MAEHLNSNHFGRNHSLKNISLRALVFAAACTLSMASFASVPAPCKSGQKAAPKGSHVCAPAAKAKPVTKARSAHVAKGKSMPLTKARSAPVTNAKGKAKGVAKVKAGTRAKLKPPVRTKLSAIGAGAAAVTTANIQAAPKLPPIHADVDCGSTQTILQGGVAECAPTALLSGPVLRALPQSNPGTACFAALSASHSARRLSPQVPFLSASAATPEALANKAVPNRMEKEELGSVIAGYGMCLDMAASWRRETYAPAVVNTLDAYWGQAQSILNGLVAGRRSFGDAARAMADNDTSYNSQISKLENNLHPTTGPKP